MKRRVATVLLATALTVAGCGVSATPPPSISLGPAIVRPAGAEEVTAPPQAPVADCDVEASLRPGTQPPPGDMPPESTMAKIQERGRLIVGVDQNTFMSGFRDPATGELAGFDIDLAREIAQKIFGDPDKIVLQVVDAGQRESALKSGQVDLIVRTFSITCARKENVDFSTVYLYAKQRILVPKKSRIDSAASLSGKRVCAVTGTTSLIRLYELKPKPNLVEVPSWTDCLVMLQQAQVDAISTDDVVLLGLAKQDPSLRVVGDSLGIEPYGVGVAKGKEDLVRFVNGVLAQMRADGTWERLYSTWYSSLGPSPGPPEPRYQD